MLLSADVCSRPGRTRRGRRARDQGRGADRGGAFPRHGGGLVHRVAAGLLPGGGRHHGRVHHAPRPAVLVQGVSVSGAAACLRLAMPALAARPSPRGGADDAAITAAPRSRRDRAGAQGGHGGGERRHPARGGNLQDPQKALPHPALLPRRARPPLSAPLPRAAPGVQPRPARPPSAPRRDATRRPAAGGAVPRDDAPDGVRAAAGPHHRSYGPAGARTAQHCTSPPRAAQLAARSWVRGRWT